MDISFLTKKFINKINLFLSNEETDASHWKENPLNWANNIQFEENKKKSFFEDIYDDNFIDNRNIKRLFRDIKNEMLQREIDNDRHYVLSHNKPTQKWISYILHSSKVEISMKLQSLQLVKVIKMSKNGGLQVCLDLHQFVSLFC